jgi:hypothetical protein
MTTPWYTSRSHVACFLLHDTYREKWTPSLVNSSIDILIDWNDRERFLTDMLGAHYSSPKTSNPVTTSCCPGNPVPGNLTANLQNSGVDGNFSLNYNSSTGQWISSGAFGSSAGGFWLTCGGTWVIGPSGGAAFPVGSVTTVCSPSLSIIFSQIDLTSVGGNSNGSMSVSSGGGNALGGGGFINRTNPQAHPLYPKMYCVGCDIRQNVGVPTVDPLTGNWIKYTPRNPQDSDLLQQTAGPVYSCTFSALPYDVLTDAQIFINAEHELARYVVRSPKQVGEQIQTLGLFGFKSPPPTISRPPAAPNYTPIPTPPAVQAPYRQIVYQWCLVPDPITNVIVTADALYATVNNNYFDYYYGNYPAGTLMFLGAEYERVPLTPAQNIVWNIKFNFAYRGSGWNRAYRPNNSTNNAGGPLYPDWDDVVNVGQPPTYSTRGLPPYRSSDFYSLFRV